MSDQTWRCAECFADRGPETRAVILRDRKGRAMRELFCSLDCARLWRASEDRRLAANNARIRRQFTMARRASLLGSLREKLDQSDTLITALDSRMGSSGSLRSLMIKRRELFESLIRSFEERDRG